MRHVQRHEDDRRAAGRDDLVRRVCRHDEHVALDDGLGDAARDRRAAQIVGIVALLIDELAAGHDIAGAFEHDHQLGIFFMDSRRRRAGSVFELGAIGRHRQDRLGHQRGVALAVGLRLVDQAHDLLVVHEGLRRRSGLLGQSARSHRGGEKREGQKLRAHEVSSCVGSYAAVYR